MPDKPDLTLEKLKAQAQTQMSNLSKNTKDRKLKFWEFSDNNKKKKKRPRYYKRQLFKIKKELI